MGGKRVRHRSRRRAVLPLVALSLVAGVALAWGLGHLDRDQGPGVVDAPDPTSALRVDGDLRRCVRVRPRR